ncbi:uncharacterized protein LOC107636308 [Arachis ipaensis]|uniref:uncharacterized protein LOC107636308 n=1 Tax=Arachis ipaensis TaxID=130454 RepID=UPI0007AF5F4C|nr:uncharacterized protein LOC107636308 [Arachis ipaensis]
MSESSKDARKRRKLAMKRKKYDTLGIRNAQLAFLSQSILSCVGSIYTNEDEGVMHNILNDVFTSFVDINDHVLFASSETKDLYLVLVNNSNTFSFFSVLIGFWYDEHVIRESKVSQPVFSMCCLKGKVQLPLLKEPPELLVSLLNGNDLRSKHFFKNIWAYNNLFCFTSIGGRVDTSLSNGSGPSQFILCGQNYHRIGSLLPVPGFSSRTGSLDSTLIEDLLKMLDENNVVAKSFRMAKKFYQQRPTKAFSIHLFRHRAADPRVYNEPTVSEIAGLIIGDFDGSDTARDIIVQWRNGDLKRIHETHTLYWPLQYPLLFPLFELKIQSLMTDLKDGVLWTYEYRLQTTEIMDEVISAELPDPIRFPKLYSVVTKYMIYGPCGKLRPSSPCMRNGGCSKFYPKKFVDATGFDKDGYPIYRRRNMEITYKINGVDVDNRFVVPYNPLLLMKYRAPINLEFYNKSNVIKYLFKYINKGPDRITASIRNVQTQEHGGQDQLIFHLPGKQNLLFIDHDKIPEIIEKNKYKDTMFTAWMRANLKLPHGNQLLYSEFPNYFIYLRDSQEWVPRQRGFSIGRLTFIHVGSGEIFYLRLLLNVQRGCKSFENIRTVDGVVYDSFKAACNALGLLSDDQEFINAIKKTAELSSGFQLCQLFVTLLASNSMNKPELVWRDTWRLLADDILYYRRRELQLQELVMTEEELEVLCLIEVEKLLQMNGRSLKDFSQMPFPNQDLVSHFSNSMIMNEMNYDVDQLREEHDVNLDKLIDEQKLIYERIIDTVANKRPGFFFVGIASLLLPNGRTAHSLFCIPIELNEESVCSIKKDSQRAELIRRASLIIWDEASMTNKLAFEALDRTFHDLMKRLIELSMT